MYSPKIKPDLIHELYVLAKRKGKPMTKIVSEIIEDYLINESAEMCRMDSGLGAVHDGNERIVYDV